MYEAFFHLREKPFSLLPDPQYLYLGRQHATAFTMLDYGLSSQAGFTVITGEVGSGKTTLIRHLLNRQDRDVTVGLMSNTHRALGDLLHWVLLAFSLDYRGKTKIEAYESLVDFMIDEYAHGRRAVLIIDEAQNMDVQTLEELRLLSNVNADKDQIIQLILVGQPELRDTLRRPELLQFAQRIAVDYHLGPLDKRETDAYIHHRIEVAGGDPALISSAARSSVYQASKGIPRLINTLCDTALVYAYGARLSNVTQELMEEVIEDKMRGGLFGRTGAANEFEDPSAARAAEKTESAHAAHHSVTPREITNIQAEINQLEEKVEKLTHHETDSTGNRR